MGDLAGLPQRDDGSTPIIAVCLDTDCKPLLTQTDQHRLAGHMVVIHHLMPTFGTCCISPIRRLTECRCRIASCPGSCLGVLPSSHQFLLVTPLDQVDRHQHDQHKVEGAFGHRFDVVTE